MSTVSKRLPQNPFTTYMAYPYQQYQGVSQSYSTPRSIDDSPYNQQAEDSLAQASSSHQRYLSSNYSGDLDPRYPDPVWGTVPTERYTTGFQVDTSAPHVQYRLDPSYISRQQQPTWSSTSPAASSSESYFEYLPHSYNSPSTALPYAYSSISGVFHDNVSPSQPLGAMPDAPYAEAPQLSPYMKTLPASPETPQSQGFSPSPSTVSLDIQVSEEANLRPLYSHRDQLQFFRDALSLPFGPPAGPFIPQVMYKPHTNSDRRRYVEEVDLEAPIYFWVEGLQECGISLSDALHSRVRRLLHRDEPVFQGRGPSVSIRLEWPGYRQWSRQIPTKDFRSPPGPITRAKLAKNVAKCVQRFIAERQNHTLEDEADARWRVGTAFNQIKFEDLVLVSIHHVSMGSWQPHLRLRQPIDT